MYFRQILHPDLSCASYLIADGGEAAVVDPKWDIAEYLEAAAEAGAEIRHVLETHNHADHVSGRARLIAATGAASHLPWDEDSGEGSSGESTSAPSGASAGRAIREGDAVRVGSVELVALATPGHRPEHVSYLVHDHGELGLLLSGDSLLVGDVARPDLAVPAADGARALRESLGRLLELGDEVQLWPAHVGGSLCASRNASSDTSSTIGRERVGEHLRSLGDAAAFVEEVTSSIPVRPPTVERVVRMNRSGAEDPGELPEIAATAVARLGDGTCLLDVRKPADYDAAHLSGALNLPISTNALGTRTAWAVGSDERIVLIADSLDAARQAGELLRAAGVWNLGGVSVADPQAWRAAKLPLKTEHPLEPEQLLERLRGHEITLLDVREPSEWREGHVVGSSNLPLSELRDGSCDRARSLRGPIAVVCASGTRAVIAASVLRRRGHSPVWPVRGGVGQLERLGAPMAPEHQ